MNTELLLLQAHARQLNPRGVPSDFKMSTIAWDAASDLVSELPSRLIRKIVLLYGQYDATNRNVASFAVALTEFKSAKIASSSARDAETMVLRIIDVFNTGLDATLARGQEVLPELATLAKLNETDAEKANTPNYEQIAVEHMLTRQQHLEALRSHTPERKAES